MIGRRGLDATVFVVGFMGAGKTEAGRALARLRGWPFEDTDASVETSLGRPVAEIFRESGEGRFREAERSALHALAASRRTVVATGGGLFLGVDHRSFVRTHGVSVWIDTDLAVVASRLGDGGGRPLWPREDAVDLRAFFERRRAAYALADVKVDGSAGGPDDVARAIDDRLRALRR